MFREEIEQELGKYFESSDSIQGLVLEASPDFKNKKGGENFEAMMSRIIALLGSVLSLPSGRVLAILSDTADRELIAHQLERSVKVKTLVMFIADEPSEILEYIGPYL
ncbi:MAG: hypothetical protein LBL70_06710 [Treponema sp.]|nr:hypothetical protein [Treponema sp.]